MRMQADPDSEQKQVSATKWFHLLEIFFSVMGKISSDCFLKLELYISH